MAPGPLPVEKAPGTHDEPQAPQPALVRGHRSQRLPPPGVDQGGGLHRRRLPGPPGHRDRELLERGDELQLPPPDRRRARQAGRLARRRIPARVPGDLALRAPHEADDDALPEPHVDGRGGVHPEPPLRRRRAPVGLRQDHAGHADGRGERGSPRDHGDRRPDAARDVRHRGGRLRHRPLALLGRVPRGPARRGVVVRARELLLALVGALHGHGHGLDDGLDGRIARHDAAGERGDPRARLAAAGARRGDGEADRRDGGGGPAGRAAS